MIMWFNVPANTPNNIVAIDNLNDWDNDDAHFGGYKKFIKLIQAQLVEITIILAKVRNLTMKQLQLKPITEISSIGYTT